MNLRKLLIAAMGVAVVAGGATAASADTPWQNHHPRRVEVNHRLDNLDRRVRYERVHGDISALQAARLHERARFIRMQERTDARFNHSHVTRAEQARLNHQENRPGRHIG